MIINLKNIKKNFIDVEVLRDCSFIVEEKDKIGLIGANGSGKSTIFNILTGEISKDGGDYFKKDIEIAYLKQHQEFSGTLYELCIDEFKDLFQMESRIKELEKKLESDASNYEKDIEVLSSLHEKFNEGGGFLIHSKIRGTLIGLGFSESDFNREFSTLSGGQKSRLSLAKILLRESDLLLLDEPTNHLDRKSIEWLEKYIASFPKAVIIISHDRYFLNKTTNKTFHLANGKVRTYLGNYDYFKKEYEKEREQLLHQYQNEEKELKRQTEIIERFRSYNREKSLKQARSREKALEKREKVEAPVEIKTAKFDFKLAYESGNDLYLAENLKKAYGEKVIFEGLNFSIYRGDKVGIIGPNGVGKSTLIKVLTGELSHEGSLITGSKIKLGYFDQELRVASEDNDLIEEIRAEYPKLLTGEIRNLLARFLFFGDAVFKKVSELSGGERGRVNILKLMLSGANTLILDEPTNHLDIESKEVFEEQIRNFKGTVISVSHDRYFLNNTCNKIFNMSKNSIDEYLGNYDYFLEKTTPILLDEAPVISKTKLQEEKKSERQQREEKKKLRIKLSELEKNISCIENEINEIDNVLSDPKIYEDYQSVSEWNTKRENLQIKLDEFYAQWMEFVE